MRPIARILKSIILIIIALLVTLISASLILQDKAGEIVLRTVTSNLAVKLEYGSFRLTLIKKFPKASVELKNVVIHSSRGFDRGKFPDVSTDTLLTAKNLSLEFRMAGMLTGDYDIERIGVRNGVLNLLTDTTGAFNYNLTKEKGNRKNEGLINLERINLNDIRANYYNNATRLFISGIVKNGHLKSRISGNNIDFTASSETQISLFRINNTALTKKVESELDVDLRSTDDGLVLRNGKIRIEGYTFVITGSVSADNYLNLELTGRSIDISRIIRYLPEKYSDMISAYRPSGMLRIDGKITGPVTHSRNPHIDLNFSLGNGHFRYGKSDISINDLSFNGNFSNGTGNNPETAYVTVSNLTGSLGSGQYTGSFAVRNFTLPDIDLALTGKVYPGEIHEFLNLSNNSSASGEIDMDLKLSGRINREKKFTLSDLVGLNPDGHLSFNSFSLGLDKYKLKLKDINGNIQISKHITCDDLELNYNGQRIKINGNFLWLPGWIAGRDVQPDITAKVSFNSFSTSNFIFSNSQQSAARSHGGIFQFPQNIKLNIDFTVDSLTHRTFYAENIRGKLIYKPGLATFKPLTIKSMGGIISGNCFIAQNSGNSFITKGDFNIREVDINNAFKKMNNFGQDFIKAENLAGTISGTLSFLMPLDSLFKPEVKSLIAEGHFSLLDGVLNNFDPVKRLSTYIDISELENINFDRLENDFFIRNNSLHIPMMDIRSSAADIRVTGQHLFNNDYEYHVKMLLSVILSKKTRRTTNNNTEFGEIEEDGLGRTSLLLKILSRDGVVKVSYDAKAVKDEIKADIRNERQNLKKILNEEYGWYKNDSTLKDKTQAAKRTRFKISWDGIDSLKNEPDTLTERKTRKIRNLLRTK